MTRNIILKHFLYKRSGFYSINGNILKKSIKNKDEYWQWLNTISNDPKEAIAKLYNNIESTTKCKECGREVKFTGSLSKPHLKFCCNKCAQNNKDTREKYKFTNIEKYGYDNAAKSDYVKNKIIKTNLTRYGSSNVFSSKYGKNKVKSSLIEHYGVDNYWKTQESKDKRFTKELIQKSFETKIKNGTINISKSENKTYEILREKYPDVLSQYKDNRYPFNCDFYIPSQDLFIECNYHWTHGDHPYNEENDKEIIEFWKSKNSKYYNNAINTWTIRDVNKKKYLDKLNSKVFYSFKEFLLWIN
jgi:hypothetical protein